MSLTTMYKAKSNSPKTTLAADITAAATSMTLADASVLPAAPNLCTIGSDESAEVVLYNTITGNVVSGLIRGQSGTTASVWESGTVVARDFTSYDHDTFIDNINDLSSGISNGFAKEIMYFSGQTVSVGSNAQIMRIPSSGTDNNITTNTVVLECTFASPANVTSNIAWESFSGYVTFTGTCTTATTANVTLGTKGN